LVLKELKEHKVLLGLKVLKELKAQFRGLKEQQVHKAAKVLQVIKVFQVHKVIKVLQVHKVLKVQFRELKVRQGLKVLKEL
jgi:hypothetical protein